MGKYSENPTPKKGKKGLIIFLVILLLLLTVAVGAAIWVLTHYHIVSGNFYAKDTAVLDLREEEIDTRYFDKLQEKMPETQIRWNIPFQDGKLADDVTEITVSSLSEGDIAVLDYARQLKTVNAEGCTDYAVLEQLRQRRPELEVNYSVAFSNGSSSWDVEALEWGSFTEADIPLLQHLPNLKSVVLTEGNYDLQSVENLRSSLHSAGLEFGMLFQGEQYSTREESLVVEGITDGELEMLQHFDQLQTLQLKNPAAAPEKVFTLEERLSGVEVSWEVTLGDQTFDVNTTEVDLTGVEVKDLAEVEQKMAYLPELTSVTFGVCGVDNANWGNSKSKLTASPIENEDMAAYRNRVRDKYKVVWTVRLGPNNILNSSATLSSSSNRISCSKRQVRFLKTPESVTSNIAALRGDNGISSRRRTADPFWSGVVVTAAYPVDVARILDASSINFSGLSDNTRKDVSMRSISSSLNASCCIRLSR